MEELSVANQPSKEYLESLYEVDLPESIRHDLDAYQKGLQEERACIWTACLMSCKVPSTALTMVERFQRNSINTFGRNTFGKIRSFWISSDMMSASQTTFDV